MKSIALVIIDMQKAYFHNEALEVRRDALVRACNELIGGAKQHGIPVFSVVTEHQKDRSTWTLNMLDDGQGYLFADESDSDVVDGLDISSAIELKKTRDSAFFETDLAEQLGARQIDTIVLAGVSTHTCVAQTAADAYAYNLRVILAGDAIASHDPSRHESALGLLEQEYRQKTLSNEQVLSAVFQKSSLD